MWPENRQGPCLDRQRPMSWRALVSILNQWWGERRSPHRVLFNSQYSSFEYAGSQTGGRMTPQEAGHGRKHFYSPLVGGLACHPLLCYKADGESCI